MYHVLKTKYFYTVTKTEIWFTYFAKFNDWVKNNFILIWTKWLFKKIILFKKY